jgi:hypothetical protein
VREQVPLERAQGLDDRLAGVLGLFALKRIGGGFDGIQIVGDAAVLGPQTVDDGADGRVGGAQLDEEVGILCVVVEVDEAAVAQAADLELPEDAAAPERIQLLAQLDRGKAIGGAPRKLLDGLEVAADVGVHREQSAVCRAPAGCLGRSIEGRPARLQA